MTRRAVDIWEEVLKRALQEVKAGPAEQEIQDYILSTQQDAEAWLRSDSEAPGSFLWVCEMLDLSPSAVRKQGFGKVKQ